MVLVTGEHGQSRRPKNWHEAAESKSAGAGVQVGASVESYRLLVVRPHEILAPAPSYTTSAAEMVRKKEYSKDLLGSWHSNAPASFSVYCETENIDMKSTPGWQRRSERNGDMAVAGSKCISIVRGKNETRRCTRSPTRCTSFLLPTRLDLHHHDGWRRLLYYRENCL